jgi:hypothetical protein
LVLLEKNVYPTRAFLTPIPAPKIFFMVPGVSPSSALLLTRSTLDICLAGGYDVAVCKAAVTREHGFY